jgi:hypothetical protein
MGKYDDRNYNQPIKVRTNHGDIDLYCLIARQLTTNPNFLASLLTNPRDTLRTILPPNTPEDVIDSLVSRLRAFIQEEGEVLIVPAAQDYYNSECTNPLVPRDMEIMQLSYSGSIAHPDVI